MVRLRFLPVMIDVIPFQLVPFVCPLHQLLGYSLTTADIQAVFQVNQHCLTSSILTLDTFDPM